MKRILAMAALVGLGLGLAGCGGRPTASKEPAAEAEKAAETAATETTLEEAPSNTGPVVAAVDVPADAPPDEVGTAFLEARRAGDVKTTAALLTSNVL